MRRVKVDFFFFNQKLLIFFLFHHKNMLWVLIRSITEALLMSINNICFDGSIKYYHVDIPFYLELWWNIENGACNGVKRSEYVGWVWQWMGVGTKCLEQAEMINAVTLKLAQNITRYDYNLLIIKSPKWIPNIQIISHADSISKWISQILIIMNNNIYG